MKDSITIIDFGVNISEILNLSELPKKVQTIIEGVEEIDSIGFQELHGRTDRKLVFSASGYWDYHDEAMENVKGFVIDSIGAKYNEGGCQIHLTWSK